MKLVIASLLIFAFMIGIASAGNINMTLLYPPNATISYILSPIILNGTANTTATTSIKNVTLWTNHTGTWLANQTINYSPANFNIKNTGSFNTGSASYDDANNISVTVNDFVRNVTAQIQGGPGFDVVQKFKILYTDASSVESGDTTSSTGSYVEASYVNPNPSKNVSQVVSIIRSSSGGSVVYTKDINATIYRNNTITANFSLPLLNNQLPMIWNIRACDEDGNCTFALNNYTLDYKIFGNSFTYNTTLYETSRQSFILNFTTNTTPTAVKFYLNNTEYTASITGSNPYIATATADIPLGSGNVNSYFNITTSEGITQTTTISHTISSLDFALCNSTLTVPYINISFKNETTNQESVNAAIITSWNYYLGSGSVSKNFSYSNITENKTWQFCPNAVNNTLFTSPTIYYSNSYSLQRTYTPGILTLTNSSTDKILYLLPNVLGQSITFQVVSASLQSISGATVSIISSTLGAIESRVTDSAGAAGFWLNPLTTYTITASKTGYPTTTVTITPGSQTQYTITLGSTNSTSTTIDYFRGIGYSISPTANYLSNGTAYSFNFTLNSTYHTVSSFGFTLTNSSGYVFNSGSSATNGATVSISLNTFNNETLFMNYYWIINGTTINGTRTWIIYDDSESSNSIANFVSHLKSYLGSDNGIFGLKRGFSLNIVIFLVAFTLTGIISYKFGFTSITPVLLTLTFIVAIFDTFALDLIEYAGILEGGIGSKATMLLGLITLGAFIKENYS